MRFCLAMFALAFCLLSVPAEAQRDYSAKVTNKTGRIDVKTLPDGSANPLYKPINTTSDRSKDTRVDDHACAAMRAQPDNPNSYADDFAYFDPKTKISTICPCAPNSLWVERMVYCIADVPNGLIYNVTLGIITSQKVKTFFNAVYGSVALLGVVFFGLKMVNGSVRSITKDGFLFVAKLGGILTFWALFPQIYDKVMGMAAGLVDVAADSMSGLVNICGPGGRVNVWAQLDCALDKVLGIGAVSGVLLGVVAYLAAMIFAPAGLPIFFAGMYVIVMLIFSVLKCIQVYLMSILAISFTLLLGPIFVPLILFGATKQRFTVWFNMLIGYTLQPMALMLFMGISVAVLNFAIFVGPYSMFGVISNTDPKAPENFRKVAESDPGGVGDLGQFKVTDNLMSGKIQTNPETLPSVPGYKESLQYGTAAGATGVTPNLPVIPKDARAAATGPESAEVGVPVTRFDTEKLVDGLNKRTGAVNKKLTTGEWISRVFAQVSASGMVLYVLYTMLGNIPKITADLVAHGSGNLAQVQVLGEGLVKRGMALAQAAARAYAGDTSAAQQTMGDAVKAAVKNVVGRR